MYRTQTRMIEGELCRRIRSQKFPTPSDGARTQFISLLLMRLARKNATKAVQIP